MSPSEQRKVKGGKIVRPKSGQVWAWGGPAAPATISKLVQAVRELQESRDKWLSRYEELAQRIEALTPNGKE